MVGTHSPTLFLAHAEILKRSDAHFFACLTASFHGPLIRKKDLAPCRTNAPVDQQRRTDSTLPPARIRHIPFDRSAWLCDRPSLNSGDELVVRVDKLHRLTHPSLVDVEDR
jgi:hypothetical protein